MSSAHILYPGQYLFLLGRAEESDMMWRFQKPGHHPTPLPCYAHCVPLSGKPEPIRGPQGGVGETVCAAGAVDTSSQRRVEDGSAEEASPGALGLGRRPVGDPRRAWDPWALSPAVTGLLIWWNRHTSTNLSLWTEISLPPHWTSYYFLCQYGSVFGNKSLDKGSSLLLEFVQ